MDRHERAAGSSLESAVRLITAIARHANDGVMVTAAAPVFTDSVIVHVNPAFAGLTGFGPNRQASSVSAATTANGYARRNEGEKLILGVGLLPNGTRSPDRTNATAISTLRSVPVMRMNVRRR